MLTPVEQQGWQDIATAPIAITVLIRGRHSDGSLWWNVGTRVNEAGLISTGSNVAPTEWHWIPGTELGA